MNISLPLPLKKWVSRQAAKKGFTNADAFVLDMLRREQAAEAREQIDSLLLEAIEGESTPMTSGDWEKIRAGGRKRFQSRRKT